MRGGKVDVVVVFIGVLVLVVRGCGGVKNWGKKKFY